MMCYRLKMDYLRTIYYRYHKATNDQKSRMLDELCKVCGYNRKYAIRRLSSPPSTQTHIRRKQNAFYAQQTIVIIHQIWQASGYLWSERLKAAIPIWLPWVKKHFGTSRETEKQLLSISPSTIDRKLKDKKLALRKRSYGSTRPGTLLKHNIPIKVDSWDVHSPGFLEVDLVSHSGPSAEGLFIYTLDCVDIYSGWSERRAIMGKYQIDIVRALKEIQQALPFKLKAIDSDNGSEFINYHLKHFCSKENIQFTRGRPYKKDDNAHIEQKNWTHVRQIFGYDRYDTKKVLDAMNDLYKNELRLFQNFFQPSVKLLKIIRIGSKIKKIYDYPLTPYQRVCKLPKKADLKRTHQLHKLLHSIDPFELSKQINRKLTIIYEMASRPKRRYDTAKTKQSQYDSENAIYDQPAGLHFS